MPAPAATAGAAKLPSDTTPSAANAKRKSPALAIAAVVAGVTVIGIAGYFLMPRSHTDNVPAASGTPVPVAANTPVPVSAPAASVPTDPGVMLISAVGLADPSDQKYQADKSLLAADLRSDSKSQLVEKAIALYLDRASLAKNYNLLRDKLLANSSSYIASIVQEGEPQLGKDGLMHVTMQAAVKVREVQKSLNQMSRDERIDFIRNNGDPKISVSIGVRGDGADATAQNSQVAENLLKERIKSFGFRTWSDDPKTPAAPGKSADFAVTGEAKLKKLSLKLAASGITVDKYLLTSWTVKCVDRQSGEEIYFNNKLPFAEGSWATEELALAAIGGKIADEFSRDFFVRNFNATGQKIALKIDGLPNKATEDAIARELVGLQPVISVVRRTGSPAIYDMQVAGGVGPLTDLVASAILRPLNAKFGQACFNLGATNGDQVGVTFDKACSDQSVLARLDTNPPASLYAAPPARQNSIIKDPNAVRKLTTI